MAKTKTSFTPGSPKIGGRQKGTPNRTTQEMRDMIQQVMDKNLSNLESDLEQMNATSRWMILQKLATYFMPTLTKNDNHNENSGKMSIIIKYADDTNNKPGDEGIKDAE